MGFWSSIIGTEYGSPSQADTPSISEEDALFSDFDETVARLKAFDLETDIEPEEGEPFTLSAFGNDKHDVK